MTSGGAESESPAVCLRGIRKRFGFREVLRGVDLTVARGECLAIFGPNGAGKSTLLRIAATQWRPSHGDGEILGHDIQRDVRSIRRRLGVVFHHSLLRHELTLDENVRFAADLYGIRLRAGGRVDALIERLGLAARRRDQVGTFSQGMQKRANIIRSLLHDPDLWLLDEPFSGLDPQGRALLSDMVRDFVRQGGAVVLVTHQVELGKDLATRTLSMDDGEIVDAASESRGGGRVTQFVLFARLVKWDFLRELRRKEAVLNMILFAVLVLFVISMGAGPLIDEWRRAGRLLEREGLPESLFVDLGSAVGPVLLWATVLFAGTVGLSQSFAAEREGEGLVAIVLAPLDLGVFYLAKVFATWVYVILMEVFLLGAYAVLFTVPGWREVGLLLIVLVVFSLGYMAAGVVLAAMTSALRRGGEVVLRILLFPLLMPLIYLTLRVEEALLGFATPMGVPIPLPSYVAMALAFDVIYLTAGFVIFPKVLEE